MLLALSLLTGVPQALAQSDPWTDDANRIASDVAQHPGVKSVVVVLDISGSMLDKEPATGLSRWQEARAATSLLLSTSLHAGDSITIEPFDSEVEMSAAPNLVHPSVKQADIDYLGQFMPTTTSGETGTNMRLAHYRALQMQEAQNGSLPAASRPWMVIVVVSDGFNDAPPGNSPAWKDYTQFCDVHSNDQNRYPDTPECNTWRLMAQRFEATGQGKTYGIGVKVEDGVPMYRAPGEVTPGAATQQAQPTAIAGTLLLEGAPIGGVQVHALDSSGTEVDSATSQPDGTFSLQGLAPGLYNLEASKGRDAIRLEAVHTGSDGVVLNMARNLIWVWILIAVLALVIMVASAALARSRKQAKVRIQIKDSGGRNRTYWMGGGARVSIGGKEAPNTFPLEVFPGPVAHLRHSASGYSLLTEKGITVETAGRKFTGAGPVSENSTVMLSDQGGHQGSFEFHDISTRTRTTASVVAGKGQGADPYAQLDANMKG